MTETRIVNQLTGGEKGSKVERFDLIPPGPLQLIARVYGYGCIKYASRNWEKGYDWGLSYAALQRHLHAFWSGEDLDPESGLPHLAHAAWHCLALMEWARTHPELDDRPSVDQSPKKQAGFTSPDIYIKELKESWPTGEAKPYRPVHKDEILMKDEVPF